MDPQKISTELIGAQPGEKLYEELMSHEEVSRVHELPNMYVILPAMRAFYHKIDYRLSEHASSQCRAASLHIVHSTPPCPLNPSRRISFAIPSWTNSSVKHGRSASPFDFPEEFPVTNVPKMRIA